MSSKLFGLKEWVTVPDAAAYLSEALGEAVTDADILRFSLDGHLTLSVYLPNGAEVKRGKVVTHSIDELTNAVANNDLPDDINWIPVPKSFATKGVRAFHDQSGETVPFITSLRLDDSQWITLNKEEVVSVWGLWDLPMKGGERLDVEHEYLSLTGGPSITAVTMDGAFIWRGPDDICQIQENYDDNEYQAGSKAAGLALERHIADDEIGKDEADRLRAIFKNEREEYKARRQSRKPYENFHPSEGLPEDAVMVVRTKVLQEFVRGLSDHSDDGEGRPITTRQRRTWLTVIAALCKEAGIDPSERGATKRISIAVNELGATIGDDTVRAILSEIPNAVESRSK